MSENASPSRVVVLFGLYILKESVVAVPTLLGLGLNHMFVNLGGWMAFTDRVAEAVLPVPALPVVTAPLVLV